MFLFGTPSILTNCTVVSNSASYYCGGIDVDSGAPLKLVNSIVVGNNRAAGAGAVPDDLTVNVSNKGLIDPTSAFDLIGVGGLAAGPNHIRVGVTPAQLKLGPLANNGGPTQTMALLPGSIAIDAGSNASALGPDGKPLATDQRGLPRISGVRWISGPLSCK